MSSAQEHTRWPFSAGQAWLREAVAVLRAQPLRLLVLGLVLQLIGGLSQSGLFAFVFLITIPVFTAGMLQGMHLAATGQRPSPGVLFAGFAQAGKTGRLLLLGLIGIAILVFVASITLAGSLANMDPDLLARMEAGDVTVVEDLDPRVIQRVLFGLLTGLLIGGTLSFFAVPLVWFRDAPVGRAIGGGILAMLRQWRALLVLGLLLGLLSIPLAVLTVWVLSAQMVAGETSPVLALLVMLLGVLYQLTLFASQYVCFRAIFDVTRTLPKDDGPEETNDDDQLVA